MHIVGKIIRGKYFDSVSLMLVARETLGLPGVKDAAAVMATDENKRILKSSGMEWPELAAAGDTDLALGIKADSEAEAVDALEKAEELLVKKKETATDGGAFQPRSLAGALNEHSDANLVLISIAGKYAADEAMQALRAGKHVMLFSDNIPLEDEIALKTYAAENGLLVMGPDCGTAIIGGIPLAFANVVRRGSIGMVAASGTGLQEVSSLIHNLGRGVSHAIGTGGRDIKKEVGGLTFLAALQALKEDPDTRVVALVSKTPAPEVLEKIGAAVRDLGKPVVAVFLGADVETVRASGAIPATTLEEAAHLAVALDQDADVEAARTSLHARATDLAKQAVELAATARQSGKYLRGLFCGGTFSQEAVFLLQPLLKDIRSNVSEPLSNPDKSEGHTIVDLGGDEFTAGRPHPMIDYSLRNRRILDEARDPETAAILLDVVLGYGSNMTPGEELAPVIREVCEMDDPPVVVFHVCGTDDDPQARDRVIALLKEAGGVYAPSNASAVMMAGKIIERINREDA